MFEICDPTTGWTKFVVDSEATARAICSRDSSLDYVDVRDATASWINVPLLMAGAGEAS